MAGDNSSRRFVKLWWLLAFMAGIAAGALCVTLFGLTDTIWGLAGLGIPVAGLIATLEWYGSGRTGVRSPQSPWRRVPRANTHSRKPSKARPNTARGQLHAITGRKLSEPPLHAITGRKTADPPSSAPS